MDKNNYIRQHIKHEWISMSNKLIMSLYTKMSVFSNQVLNVTKSCKCQNHLLSTEMISTET